MPKTDLLAELERKIQEEAEQRAQQLWKETAAALWPRLCNEVGPLARWPIEPEFNALRDVALPSLSAQIAEHLRRQATTRLLATLLPEEDTNA